MKQQTVLFLYFFKVREPSKDQTSPGDQREPKATKPKTKKPKTKKQEAESQEATATRAESHRSYPPWKKGSILADILRSRNPSLSLMSQYIHRPKIIEPTYEFPS